MTYLSYFFKEFYNYLIKEYYIILLFFVSLIVIIATEKGSLPEVSTLFLGTVTWNILLSMMNSFYSEWNMSTWSIFQGLSTSIFILIALYWFIFNWEWQFLFAQLAFVLSAIKRIWLDTFWKNFSFINTKFIVLINFISIILFIYYWDNITISSLIQIVALSFSSTGLSIPDPKKNYFFVLIWTCLFIVWAVYSMTKMYFEWSIPGILIAYFLASTSLLISYLKVFKKFA